MNDRDGQPPVAGTSSTTVRADSAGRVGPPVQRAALLLVPVLAVALAVTTTLNRGSNDNQPSAPPEGSSTPGSDPEPRSPSMTGDSSPPNDDEGAPADPEHDDQAGSVTAPEPAAPATATPVPTTAVSPDQPPTVVAWTLDRSSLALSGTVPDQSTKETLEAAMAEVYGPWATSELAVDPEVAPAPGLDRLPAVMTEFGHAIDGRFELEGDELTISGHWPDADSIRSMLAVVAPSTGLPRASITGMAVTDLDHPDVSVEVRSGGLTVAGVVGDDEARAAIVEAASTTYGPANVSDSLVVDDGVYHRIDVERFSEVIAAFGPVGDHTAGIRDGGFYTVVQGGITLGEPEPDFSPRARRLLDRLPAILGRSTTVIEVIGHTDDIGTELSNETLSQARAAAVADYLISLELADDRFRIVGRGEAEPVAPNSTEEGRARNNRVVVSVGQHP